MIQTFIIAAAINPILPSLLTLQPAIYGPMTPASTRIAPGLVMFNNVTSADQISPFFTSSARFSLNIATRSRYEGFIFQSPVHSSPSNSVQVQVQLQTSDGIQVASSFKLWHFIIITHCEPVGLPSLCSTSRAFQVLQVQPGGGGSSLRDSFDFELHPALCPEAVGRTLSRNGEVMVAYPQVDLLPAPLSFNLNPEGFIFLRQVRHTQLDFSLHQVHKVQHYPLTVALRCITSSQRGRSRASFLEIQQVHERRNYVYQRRNYGYMSINSFTSSLQALISSSSLFAFHSTQLLNTEWTGCSSLIHATQRLKMIVPSVHIFAGFKLLSFKNAQSHYGTIEYTTYQVPASGLNSQIFHLHLNQPQFEDNRRTFLSRQNPPEANDALSGLAMHSVKTRNASCPSARCWLRIRSPQTRRIELPRAGLTRRPGESLSGVNAPSDVQ
ncbi:hypothetical protein C8R43DRAFT_948740 [Mycena crocata]|nr:hypothetical protein C8R43DRAFT_948740 [Mycena crocata]